MEIKFLSSVFFLLLSTQTHSYYCFSVVGLHDPSSKGGKKLFGTTGDKAKLSAEHSMYDGGGNVRFLTVTVQKTPHQD